MSRMNRQRLAILALPVAAALAAACFAGDTPTEQIGGTQFGMLLNAVSPVKVPVMQATATGTGTSLTQIVARLTNFKPLAEPAAYQFYAVGAGAGDTVPVTATLSRIRNDSVVNSNGTITVNRTVTALGTSSVFSGTENNDTLVATFAGAQFGGTTRRWLVVTIQANQAAPTFTSSTPQPVWYAYRATSGGNVTTTAGTSSFGTFSVTAPVVFSGGGRGRSAFWDINSDGHLVYQAVVEQIQQPPRGYFYEAWLRDTRTRRAFRMSDVVDNAGSSLFNADQLTIPGSVAQLPVGRFGVTEEDVDGEPLNSFDGVHLVVEPKLGVATKHGLSTVLQGVVGDTLGFRGLGAIDVVVTRAGAATDSTFIVVVPKDGTAPIGTPRPALTDASANGGHVIITGIPAGPVELIVTPKGATSAVTPRPTVTVLRKDTVAVTVALP